jgi:phage/plasmid-like protein (TIGR03299 family)
MAHELDITDGQASFANSRSDAWHRLGQSIGHTMTAREALQAARLAGWNVRKMALQVPQEPVIKDTGVTTPPPLAVPDFYATVRTNPINARIDVLGVVGSKYEPVQNEASCDLLDALVDQSGGAHFETAGALRGGRETFVTMKLPNSMVFDGKDGSKDRTEFYLVALNSHDGSSKFRFLITPIRIVCANTQSAALASAKASWGISHTGGARFAIQEARHALKLSWRYIEAFEAEAAALYAAPMDTEQMRRFANTLLEVDSAGTAATLRHRRERANGIVKLWTSSPTVAPIAGTRWAAYNAVTEFLDHIVPVRGARTSTDASTARALRTVTGAAGTGSLKAQAFRLLQTL